MSKGAILPQFSHTPLLSRLAWGALIYTITVILWGAVVRITGAGAGCGDHWPLCDGVVVPQSFDTHRLIEFSHRATSSLNGLVVIVLAVAAWRLTPKEHAARSMSLLTIGLIILEGLVGGLQVLFGLTAKSTDPARGFFQGIHLANTFALVGSLFMTVLLSYGYALPRVRFQGLGLWSWVGLALTLFLGMAGAVTALGDLLFVPAASNTPIETIKQDYAATASIIENLRLVHPLMAILGSAFLVWLSLSLARMNSFAQRWNYALLGILALQMAVGLMNVMLKAPAWIQLVHLLLAIALWLVLVGLIFFAFQTKPSSIEEQSL